MRQLIATDSGRLSLTKLWSFIGCAVATFIVIYMTLNDKMTWEIFVGYLGTVGGFSQISKWLAYRYGVKADVVTASESSTDTVQIKKCDDCVTTVKSTVATKSTTESKPKPEEQPGD
jgi:hypothetical protein